MLHDFLTHPPATHDFRPEKKDIRPGTVSRILVGTVGAVERLFRSRFAALENILPLIAQHDVRVAEKSDLDLRIEAKSLGLELQRCGFRIDLVAQTFAIIRELADRNVGKRHFDVQMMGGWALLRGMIVEMETGEGKTLTATLAAGTAALAGIPVHVLTVNDYLTWRDAEEMRPIYRALGLTIGCIVHHVPVTVRRAEYSCDITYCTNKEIVFDYLRDKLTLDEMRGASLRLRTESLYTKSPRQDRLLMRGLCYAITDEADSLLIDESRTPLIISGSVVGRDEVNFMQAVLEFAADLENEKDFSVDSNTRQIRIKHAAEKRIRELVLPPDTSWTGAIRRNEMIRRAVTALHLFERDKDYLVRDGKVQIIDPFTGRVMPDRSWEQGLQQLIELKEGCEVTEQQETVAKISFQKFFRRYINLAGMTGTAREVTGELWRVYRLPVVSIYTHRPLLRKKLPDRIFADHDEWCRYLVDRVSHLHWAGRPVLIGTGSVAASEAVSEILCRVNLVHTVLNAKNDAAEAEIVAKAGEYGAITIATNMAGRGTDIKLGPGVREAGGLHVILTELHEAARIDRQLAGRCARQGDPGSHEAILLLGDAVMKERKGGPAGMLIRRIALRRGELWNVVAKRALVHIQRKTERFHERMRKDLFKQDVLSKNLMSFSRSEE